MKKITIFAGYNVLLCIMCTRILGEKIFHFNVLIQLLIYLYLETKPIIIFQGIILYMDIVIVL